MRLSPPEYYYLSNLIAGDSLEMLKLCLQDLCIRDVLRIETRAVQIDSRYHQKRLRLFFSHGKAYDPLHTQSEAEQFLLKPFLRNSTLPLSWVRKFIKKKTENSSFDDLLYRDLKRKGLCQLKVLPSKEARRIRKQLTKQIEELDFNFDTYYSQSKAAFSDKLESLGSFILFLSVENLAKLGTYSDELRHVKLLSDSTKYFHSHFFESIGLLSSSSFTDSFSSFDGIDSFGGFGGGDFGGGGAGGDW